MDSRHEKYSSNTKKHAPIAPCTQKGQFRLLPPTATGETRQFGVGPKTGVFIGRSLTPPLLPQYVGNVVNVWAVFFLILDHNL